MQMTESGILIATDPEFFLKDSQTGIITSVAGKLGYGKENKLDLGNGVRVQEDNVLLEFDTDPHSSFSDFEKNIMTAFDACSDVAGKLGLELVLAKSSHVFSAAEIAEFPESGLEFGCDPDYNALTGMRNPKPASADAGLRTAGGHIHIGYDHLGENMLTSENQKVLGVMCDYFHGLESLLMDDDDMRRELYGKAGSVRFKPYGIEYRTLSNFWLEDASKRAWAFQNAQRAFKMATGDFNEVVSMVDPYEVQRVINENDKRMAEQYVRRLEDVK